MKASTPTLSRTWNVVFWIEIGICFATCLFWLLAPNDFLQKVYNIQGTEALRNGHFLLLQGGLVVFCAYVYLYTRLMLARPFPMQSFVYLQEAMALGDVLILILSFMMWKTSKPDPALWSAQVGMASLWLVIRMVFLVQVGWRNKQAQAEVEPTDNRSQRPPH